MNHLQVTYPYKIHALHGFLGQATDWEALGFIQNNRFMAINLFNDIPIVPFARWAEMYNQLVAKSSESIFGNIFMGYSLGGRLGLHALLQNPTLWKAAIIVSAHPGLLLEEERKLRIQADEKWAEKFEKDSWTSLMLDWNSQKVFKKQSFEFKRKERDYDRHSLSCVLKTWSLGRQSNLREELSALEIPILWIVGEKDEKFFNQTSDLKFRHPTSKVCVIPNASHRVPWEQSENYLFTIINFIQSLE